MPDQNTALVSLENALVPDPFLIDGRTDRDRLAFLSQFAELINFYDLDNTVNGSWRPFLLKDPVFLMADISKTDYAKIQWVYNNTCASLLKVVQATPSSTQTGILFNQLFDQVIRLYQRIERWVYFMQLGRQEYDLKKYVVHQVQYNYSTLLWSVLSLRDFLSSTLVAGSVDPVHRELFDSFDPEVWRKYAPRTPWQDALNIPPALTEEQQEQGGTEVQAAQALVYFNALKMAGDATLRFFHTIVRHAATEYEKLKDQKSPYPDTTLLRAFVELIKVQQQELNGIAGKHLDFYYRDILKQSEQLAVADQVFITTVLGKTGDAFYLPAGTQFNAGTDANKNPIVFASLKDVDLNPAAVTTAYTLSQITTRTGSALSLALQNIKTPAVVQAEESGATITWQTFGGGVTPAVPALGVAFGSPVLFLPEGTRTITVTMNFTEAVDPTMLLNAGYWLSTTKAWHAVTPTFPGLVITVPVVPVNSLVITINLASTDPAIAAFEKAPDTLQAQWPMLKIIFNTFSGLAQPPVIASLNISVAVQGVTGLQLYNDNGLLSAKTPFQPFGPIPDINGNFMVGSAEIFSKPFQSLTLTIDWDNLPAVAVYKNGFADYYATYNDYIKSPPPPPAELETPPPAKSSWPPPLKDDPLVKTLKVALKAVTAPVVLPVKGVVALGKKVWPYVKKAGGAIGSFLGIAKKDDDEQETTEPVPPGYFYNTVFQASFGLLSDHSWNPINVQAGSAPSSALATQQQLFATDTNGALLSTSAFTYTVPVVNNVPQFSPDPSLQTGALQYDAATADGFMQMTLSAPGYGFGVSIYPAVVAWVSYKNAWTLMQKPKDADPPPSIPLPNPPFVPKIVSITAGYSASQLYDLTTTAKGSYPLQCFYYSPLANYTVYDNDTVTAFNGVVYNAIAAPAMSVNGIALFPAVPAQGTLLIGLQKLVADNYLSLFFELARSFASTSSTTDPEYYYLSTTGWKVLDLISDGTNGFTCPGIVEVNIPADIATQSPVMPTMPDPTAWIAIGVNSDPALYAQTVLLTTNGIELQRTGTLYLTDTAAPQLAAGAITKPMQAIPQIASIAQPFPSFGGKAAEDKTAMNQRVSNHLKTKGRAVSNGDFFRLIREEFNTIYYSKTSFDADANMLTLYVVKQYDSPAQPNAFSPLVSECEEKEILEYVTKRMSLFPQVTVSNFSFVYVTVTTSVAIKAGYTPKAVQDHITQAVNLYLSPWITSSSTQVEIDTGVTEAGVSGVVAAAEGVLSVYGVSLSTAPQQAAQAQTAATEQQVAQQQTTGSLSGTQSIAALPGQLLVTAGTHNITIMNG